MFFGAGHRPKPARVVSSPERRRPEPPLHVSVDGLDLLPPPLSLPALYEALAETSDALRDSAEAAPRRKFNSPPNSFPRGGRTPLDRSVRTRARVRTNAIRIPECEPEPAANSHMRTRARHHRPLQPRPLRPGRRLRIRIHCFAAVLQARLRSPQLQSESPLPVVLGHWPEARRAPPPLVIAAITSAARRPRPGFGGAVLCTVL